MNKVIGDYNAAVSIDGSTNFLLIQPGSSSTAYNKINRNVLLGVTGQPADISTVQTISNKVLNNTNTITVRDGVFTLQDDIDLTKQARFQLSGITTATTRTFTLPDRTSTLVTLDGTQTFTGANSFTGSSWSGGTIDNTNITVDNISGHTVAGNGTVYGLSIHSGVIQTAGAGTSTLLAQNAVQANQLATNTIKLGYTQITSGFSTSSTTAVQVTGLTVTVTIPAGGRSIKITAFARDIFSTSSAGFMSWSIWDGTVGSGTQLGAGQSNPTNTTGQTMAMAMAITTPSAGSKTYNIGLLTSSGTANIEAGTAFPAFILVEAI